jgi:bifunctional DNA-binding transcriptional regulator/antitoxin component of YhaV-PrlF toxin-antitoxin module
MTDVTVSPQIVEIYANDDGSLTVPPQILQNAGIYPGGRVKIARTEDGLTIQRFRFVLPQMVAEIEQIMIEEGVTLDDLMAGLEQAREETIREFYPNLLP